MPPPTKKMSQTSVLFLSLDQIGGVDGQHNHTLQNWELCTPTPGHGLCPC
jgi:hypothetical protein